MVNSANLYWPISSIWNLEVLLGGYLIWGYLKTTTEPESFISNYISNIIKEYFVTRSNCPKPFESYLTFLRLCFLNYKTGTIIDKDNEIIHLIYFLIFIITWKLKKI